MSSPGDGSDPGFPSSGQYLTRMVNFTNPWDISYEDIPEQDWLGSSLIFCRALALILQEDEGIVIDKEGEAKKWKKFNTAKLIVYKKKHMIHIIECADDKLQEGQMLWMHEEDEKAKNL